MSETTRKQPTELDRVLPGLQILRDNGASGIIANHDHMLIVGSRLAVSENDRNILATLGFYRMPEGWAIDV